MPSTFFDYLWFVSWTSSYNINGSKWQNIFSHLPHTHALTRARLRQPHRTRNQICSRFFSHIFRLETHFPWQLLLSYAMVAYKAAREREQINKYLYTHFVRTYSTIRLFDWLNGTPGCYLTIFRSPILFIARSKCVPKNEPSEEKDGEKNTAK